MFAKTIKSTLFYFAIKITSQSQGCGGAAVNDIRLFQFFFAVKGQILIYIELFTKYLKYLQII